MSDADLVFSKVHAKIQTRIRRARPEWTCFCGRAQCDCTREQAREEHVLLKAVEMIFGMLNYFIICLEFLWNKLRLALLELV